MGIVHGRRITAGTLPVNSCGPGLLCFGDAIIFVPLAGLLVLLVVVAYRPAYGAGFVWDDDYYVIANRTLRDLGRPAQHLARSFRDASILPLVHTTFWLEYRLAPRGPASRSVVETRCHRAPGLANARSDAAGRLGHRYIGLVAVRLSPGGRRGGGDAVRPSRAHWQRTRGDRALLCGYALPGAGFFSISTPCATPLSPITSSTWPVWD